MIFNLINKKTSEPVRAVKVNKSIDSLYEIEKITKASMIIPEGDQIKIVGGNQEVTAKVGDWVVRDNCKNLVYTPKEIIKLYER